MDEIAACIGEAIGRPIRYQSVSDEERRRMLVAAGLPPFVVDALEEQAAERRLHPESRVELGTHELFSVQPTTFADFARRHASVFRGEA
jgi:uncharacterized protein YbjT (DUF2867 family)